MSKENFALTTRNSAALMVSKVDARGYMLNKLILVSAYFLGTYAVPAQAASQVFYDLASFDAVGQQATIAHLNFRQRDFEDYIFTPGPLLLGPAIIRSTLPKFTVYFDGGFVYTDVTTGSVIDTHVRKFGFYYTSFYGTGTGASVSLDGVRYFLPEVTNIVDSAFIGFYNPEYVTHLSFDIDGHEVGIGEFASATAVPEPTSWAIMLFGLSLVGGCMRRARQSPTLSP